MEELEDIGKPAYKEMIKVISNMTNEKALGTDNITVELIKNSRPELLQTGPVFAHGTTGARRMVGAPHPRT
jgi:hypothetical protein